MAYTVDDLIAAYGPEFSQLPVATRAALLAAWRGPAQAPYTGHPFDASAQLRAHDVAKTYGGIFGGQSGLLDDPFSRGSSPFLAELAGRNIDIYSSGAEGTVGVRGFEQRDGQWGVILPSQSESGGEVWTPLPAGMIVQNGSVTYDPAYKAKLDDLSGRGLMQVRRGRPGDSILALGNIEGGYKDPSQIYWDQQYGLVTPIGNYNPIKDSFGLNEWAALAGMAAIAAPVAGAAIGAAGAAGGTGGAAGGLSAAEIAALEAGTAGAAGATGAGAGGGGFGAAAAGTAGAGAGEAGLASLGSGYEYLGGGGAQVLSGGEAAAGGAGSLGSGYEYLGSGGAETLSSSGGGTAGLDALATPSTLQGGGSVASGIRTGGQYLSGLSGLGRVVAPLVAGGIAAGGGGGNSVDTSSLTDAQKRLLELQTQIAEDQWRNYVSTYRPLETQFAQGAFSRPVGPDYEGLTYLDPTARISEARSTAAADTDRAISSARDTTARTLSRYGVNPGSGRFVGAMNDLGLQGAAATSANVNAAARNVRDVIEASNRDIAAQRRGETRYADSTNFARQAAAVNLGRGFPAQAATGLESASAGYGNLARTALNQNMANQQLRANQIYGAGQAIGGLFDLATRPYNSGGATIAGNVIDWFGSGSSGADMTGMLY